MKPHGPSWAIGEFALIVTDLVVMALVGGSIFIAVVGWPAGAKDQLGVLKDLGTIIAGAIGGGFVLYKLFTGWLVVNVSVSINVSRSARSECEDYVVATVCIDKGSTDAAWLRDVEVTFSQVVHGFRMPMAHCLREMGLSRSDGYPLCIAPGEKMEIATYTSVPKNCVVVIDALVRADRPLYDLQGKYGAGPRSFIESRSSAVSVPLSDRLADRSNERVKMDGHVERDMSRDPAERNA